MILTPPICSSNSGLAILLTIEAFYLLIINSSFFFLHLHYYRCSMMPEFAQISHQTKDIGRRWGWPGIQPDHRMEKYVTSHLHLVFRYGKDFLMHVVIQGTILGRVSCTSQTECLRIEPGFSVACGHREPWFDTERNWRNIGMIMILSKIQDSCYHLT